MDIFSFILIVLFLSMIFALWKDCAKTKERLTAVETQIDRFISDIESEKGTRRRTNMLLVNRVRILEGQHPLPPDDNQAEE